MTVSTLVKCIAFMTAGVLFFYILPLIPETGAGSYLSVNRKLKDSVKVWNFSRKNIKYILQWAPMKKSTFPFLNTGSSAFENNHCQYINCFVTDDRNHLPDMRDFDAIVFHGKDLPKMYRSQMPRIRSQKQKYIFATMESAHYFPVCDERYDNYFNWTWSYRLSSDVRWRYVTVYDLDGNVVAPKSNMSWPLTNQPINNDLRNKLSRKSKAAAWFVSNCKTKSHREEFVESLTKELNQYNLNVDIYGGCGKGLKCPRSNSKFCNQLLEKDYYFYFSFENSFDEDYVTEKLLTALNNFAVPVVYGGANYSRFMPPGSYLDGRELGAKQLAKTMRDIIEDRTRYEDMFRWRMHYRYKDTTTLDICNLCAKMNDAKELARATVRTSFRNWWNTDPSWCTPS